MVKKPATKAPEVDPSGLVPYDEANGPFYISYKTEVREVRVSPGKPGSEEKPVDMFSADDVARIAPTTITTQMSKICTSDRFKNVKMMAVEWPEPQIEYIKNKDGKDVPRIPPPVPLAKWKSWTYAEVWEQSNLLAKAFISLGLQDLDGVSILGFNAPFWSLSAYAAVLAGGVASGIYPTDTPEQVAFKTKVADCSIVAVDTEASLEKYASHINEMPYLKAIMIWKDTKVVDDKSEIKRSDGSSVQLLSFDQMLEIGRNVSEDVEKELAQRAENQNPGRCAFLIYTSGTTGTPKAVMVSHDNVFYQAKSNIPSLPPSLRSAKIPWVGLSYLPLSHIAGMFLDVMVPILTPGENYNPDMTICFARSYDLKMGSIVDRLTTVRPTFFFGVPRVYEKIAEKMRAVAPKKGMVARLGRFAKGKSLIAMRNQQLGGNGKKPFMHGTAKSILKKVHKKIGLDRAVMTGSAAAPMKLDVLEYWGSLGFYIPEAYGMSENTGVATAGNGAYPDWGCVGYPAAGTETKPFKVNPDDINDKTECPRAKSKDDTSEECQGEICIRGRHVMLGYLANPKMGKEHEQYILDANAKTIDKEGWLHSGDKGLLTETGMIKITGRYKELIIGAGGENIAPVPIEDDFKARCPAISNVVMIGDQRKYNVCLITLSCKGATGEAPGTNKLEVAATNLTSATTIEEASQDAKFIDILIKALNETNANDHVIQNNAFKIQKFTILPIDFSIETGELTPSLKLKRAVVEKKYAKEIDAMYEDEGSIFVQTLDISEDK